MYKILPAKRRASLESFDRFISTRPDEEPIFLMTDNPVGQKRFIEKYGPNKILVYTEMIDKIGNISISHDNDGIVNSNNSNTGGSNGNITIPEDFRYSTLEHLLIDILIASHAHHFKGIHFSSIYQFTSLIMKDL